MAKRGRGKVINVSSVLGMHPVPTIAAYPAPTISLIGVTRPTALEYAGLGVQCNVRAPGYLEGPKNNAHFESETRQQFANRFMPPGRTGPGGTSPRAVSAR